MITQKRGTDFWKTLLFAPPFRIRERRVHEDMSVKNRSIPSRAFSHTDRTWVTGHIIRRQEFKFTLITITSSRTGATPSQTRRPGKHRRQTPSCVILHWTQLTHPLCTTTAKRCHTAFIMTGIIISMIHMEDFFIQSPKIKIKWRGEKLHKKLVSFPTRWKNQDECKQLNLTQIFLRCWVTQQKNVISPASVEMRWKGILNKYSLF